MKMDAEKVKRVQELANQLCEYKLAQNMQDALGQAERIVENESSLIVKRMDDGRYVDPTKQKYAEMTQNNGNGTVTHTQMSNMTASQADSYLDQNEMKRLNRKIAEMENVVDSVMKKMNEMISEINKLQEHNKIFGQTTLSGEQKQPGHSSHSSGQSKKKVGVVMPDGRVAYPSGSEEAHPRTGNYTSTDVSVDKMFNFSGRR